MSQLPTAVPLKLVEGDDFTMAVTVSNPDGTPYDLTGATPLSHIRLTPGAPGLPLAAFDCTVEEPPTDGVIEMDLPGTTSATLPLSSYYDMVIIRPDGTVLTLVAGAITMMPQVTLV